MSKMDTRLNSIEKKVTKSVDELDEIKTSIKSLTQKVSTVEREVTTFKQQYPEIDWFIDFWCLTPLSEIFQLYHGDQF